MHINFALEYWEKLKVLYAFQYVSICAPSAARQMSNLQSPFMPYAVSPEEQLKPRWPVSGKVSAVGLRVLGSRPDSIEDPPWEANVFPMVWCYTTHPTSPTLLKALKSRRGALWCGEEAWKGGANSGVVLII
ncbi:hypothetical protein AVEN_119442-1 [Araneus ventricosus]|uniref:Uncharacterized protein n=1 Tax=Araneus ventricosus TaxID=182803 RepID=A0A4Y2DNJ7_ARAVE|nr:hypothetical protein AVEN_119442-1 [Araneus ventricosus]